jgi:hypothetical protein
MTRLSASSLGRFWTMNLSNAKPRLICNTPVPPHRTQPYRLGAMAGLCPEIQTTSEVIGKIGCVEGNTAKQDIRPNGPKMKGAGCPHVPYRRQKRREVGVRVFQAARCDQPPRHLGSTICNRGCRGDVGDVGENAMTRLVCSWNDLYRCFQ